ncbi:DNA-directed RNA polymerase [Rhizobium rhizogenes]
MEMLEIVAEEIQEDTGDSETIAVKEDWAHGDDPQSHPMWEEQLKLEYGMMRSGANKLRDQVIEATEGRQLTQVAVVRSLMVDWLPGVALAIKEWCKVWDTQRGVKPRILPLMKTIDPYMAAMVGLREIMDRIGQSKNTVMNIAMEIGRTVEYEMRVRAWEKGSKLERQLWFTEQRAMERDKVTSGHRRRRSINRFNHHLKEGNFDQLGWDAWSTDTVFRVGWEIMDAVVRHTQWFELQDDPEHVYRKGGKTDPKLLLVVKPGLTDWLAKALDYAEINQPDFRPTVMPPRPWTTSRDGGYWTAYVKPPRLVRFKASQENQKDNAADEYDALDMPRVYSAVNMLQDTAYRINGKVLEVFNRVWTELRWTSLKACLPELSDRQLPPTTPRMQAHRELNRGRRGEDRIQPDEQTAKEIFEWKKQASPIHAFNGKRASRTKACSATLRIANEFAKYDALYFPHMLDFRGRIYPIPAYLQPQGNDLARGLLTYATEAPITHANEGIRWLAICLASNWGHDKLSFSDRADWVYRNEELIRAIAADPYANNEWFSADKPWQTLAAIFEWDAYRKAEEQGEVYMCSLPGMVDGTCNGIQHLSAIIRDEVGGTYVNLVPGDKPRDIYKFVAEDLQAKLERIEQSGGEQGRLATWWLDLCGRDLPRTLTKRQVMVLPYGGTKDSFFTYTRKWLDEHDPVSERLDIDAAMERTGRITFLTKLLWDSVKENVRAAEEVMTWLQDCARVAAQENQPIYWTTPSGFTVRHFYGTLRDKQVDLRLDGQRCQVRLGERTSKLSLKEQLQGISPNFIHSLDASCLVDCVNDCMEVGITSFTSVHDAYGTHMANMSALSVLLRQAFVKTHEADVLGLFRQACLEVIIPVVMRRDGLDIMDAFEKADAMLPAPLKHGKLDLSAVLQSEYFFA